jgi:hypothetical protein
MAQIWGTVTFSQLLWRETPGLCTAVRCRKRLCLPLSEQFMNGKNVYSVIRAMPDNLMPKGL